MSVSSTLQTIIKETDTLPDDRRSFVCKRCKRTIATIAPDGNSLFMGGMYVRDKTVVYCASCNTKHKWFPQTFFDQQKTLTDTSVV